MVFLRGHKRAITIVIKGYDIIYPPACPKRMVKPPENLPNTGKPHAPISIYTSIDSEEYFGLRSAPHKKTPKSDRLIWTWLTGIGIMICAHIAVSAQNTDANSSFGSTRKNYKKEYQEYASVCQTT